MLIAGIREELQRYGVSIMFCGLVFSNHYFFRVRSCRVSKTNRYKFSTLECIFANLFQLWLLFLS